MRISYYNIGCKVNFADLSQIQKKFEDSGHSTVEFGEPSDAVFINTCTVTNKADSDARRIIRKAVKDNPHAYIGVLGCYAQINSDEISEIKGVDIVLGQKEKYQILDLVENFEKNSQANILVSNQDDLPFHTSHSADNDTRTRTFMKIQDGCDYICTYCTIPLARGNSRSMDFEQLQKSFLDLRHDDSHEIIISGVNIGEYLAPTGEKFLDVVRFLDSGQIKQRIRISSIEPNLLKSEIIDIIQNSETFVPHFHIPLQSGSPEILKLMKRRYNVDKFRELILDIKDRMPDACIGNDVIVGFPGETDAHFQETYDLIQSLPISYLHVFTYSERNGTPAANYPGVVPNRIRKERTTALRKLSDQKKTEFYKSQIGSIRTVITEQYKQPLDYLDLKDNSIVANFESSSKEVSLPLDVKDRPIGVWTGWTENYVKCLIPGDIHMPSRPYKVMLKEVLPSNYVIADII